jgi:hypothetical protein
VPTLIYTTDSPHATFVVEDEEAVNAILDRARRNGEEYANFTREGGGDLTVQVRAVKRVSGR